MLKKIALAALLGLGFCNPPAYSKDITDEKSGIVVSLPEGEGWKTEEGKVTTATNDEGVSISIIRIEKEIPSVVIKHIVENFARFFAEAKPNLDDMEKVTLHSMQVDKVSGYGTKDEKPVKFTVILVCKDSTSTVAILAYGGETAFKRHMREIDETLASIKPK